MAKSSMLLLVQQPTKWDNYHFKGVRVARGRLDRPHNELEGILKRAWTSSEGFCRICMA